MIRRSLNVGIALILSAVFSCTSSEENQAVPSDLTGNSVTYSLQPGSAWNITGTVTFHEKRDGLARIEIKLDGLTDTNSYSELPAHLHLGDITTDKAEVAAQLQPVTLKSGSSKTDLNLLANEMAVTYRDLKNLNACVKIHLSEYGEGRDIVLAAGNVGSAVMATNPGGRIKVGVCKSE